MTTTEAESLTHDTAKAVLAVARAVLPPGMADLLAAPLLEALGGLFKERIGRLDGLDVKVVP